MKVYFNRLVNGFAAYGIDINIFSKDSVEIRLVELQLKKKELEIADKLLFKDWSSFDRYRLKEELPIYVNIRGRGILSKKLDNINSNEHENELLLRALPNANAEDFEYYKEAISEEFVWLNLIRKDQLKHLVEKLTQRKSNLLKIYLGSNVINTVASLFKSSLVQTSGFTFEINENRLSNVEPNDLTNSNTSFVDIADDRLQVDYLFSYSAACNHFISSRNATSIDSEFIKKEAEEFMHKRIFNYSIKGILGIFLIGLLINFFIFQQYSEEANQKSEQLSLNRNQLEKLALLQKEKKEKSNFFKKTDLISNSKVAFITDRLAVEKPEGIYWEQLNIHPSERKVEKGEEIIFKINSVNLKGKTESSNMLNHWIQLLKKEEWIESINILQFENKANSNASFQLDITLK